MIGVWFVYWRKRKLFTCASYSQAVKLIAQAPAGSRLVAAVDRQASRQLELFKPAPAGRAV